MIECKIVLTKFFRSIMDNLSEENANENIKIFSGLLTEIEKV